MSLPSESNVYTGYWINWSKGPVYGPSITVTASKGAFIVAFVAIYIQISGAALWNVMSYLYYQWRSTREPRSGMFHQQQVLLRNSEEPMVTAMGFLRLGWYWRNHEKNSMIRNLAPFSVGLTYAVVFFVAAIVSSYVMDTNDLEVLATSKHCGFWNTVKRNESTTQMGTTAGVAQNVRWAKSLDTSSTYSHACYSANSTFIAPECQVYTNSTIPWTNNFNATCPFAKDECYADTPTSALEMDTGIMDLGWFGLNAPVRSRIGLRKVTTCSPLYPLKYVEYVNASDLVGKINNIAVTGEQILLYKYGQDRTGQNANATFMISDVRTKKTRNYELLPRRSYAGGGKFSDFDANPNFARADGDTTLFLLAVNNLLFQQPSDDPLFAVHEAAVQNSSYNNGYMYRADYPANAFGCVEQYQFCRLGGSTRCTSLQGIIAAYQESQELDFDSFQSMTAKLVYDILFNWFASIAMVGYSIPPKLLVTAGGVSGAIQLLAVPNNQWHLEVQDWHGTVLSALQQYLVSHATGPSDASWFEYFVPGEGATGQRLCDAQKVRINGGFANVHIFAFSLIIGFGGIAILASVFLKHMGIWIQRRRSGAEGGRAVPWIQDELFQVHRAAYQPRGLGDWCGEGNMVPVTREKQVFLPHWAHDMDYYGNNGGWRGDVLRDDRDESMVVMNDKEAACSESSVGTSDATVRPCAF